jgi:hypothetical protein
VGVGAGKFLTELTGLGKGKGEKADQISRLLNREAGEGFARRTAKGGKGLKGKFWRRAAVDWF